MALRRVCVCVCACVRVCVCVAAYASTADAPRLMPAIFDNMRYDAPPVKIALNMLSVEANTDAEEEQQTIPGLAVKRKKSIFLVVLLSCLFFLFYK